MPYIFILVGNIMYGIAWLAWKVIAFYMDGGYCSFALMNQIPISKLMMPWHSFVMVETTKEGKPKCVLKLEYKATNSTTSLDFLKPKLKQLIFHQFVPSDRNNTENVELANDFFYSMYWFMYDMAQNEVQSPTSVQFPNYHFGPCHLDFQSRSYVIWSQTHGCGWVWGRETCWVTRNQSTIVAT